MVSVSVPAGVLIRGHCCALMLELLFGHVSMPAECSAVLTVVWVSAWGVEHMCSDAGAVVGGWLGICLHGVLIALMSKLLIGQASLWWASFILCVFFIFIFIF